MVCCPITSKVKGYPFEVLIPTGLPVGGVALADQVKSFDWPARSAQVACRVPENVVDEVVRKLSLLLSK